MSSTKILVGEEDKAIRERGQREEREKDIVRKKRGEKKERNSTQWLID